MKVLFIFSLFLLTVSFCVANSRLGVTPKRLYEYVDLNNRTVREWMTLDQILAIVAECGKADQSRAQAHGGFFDVTDTQEVVQAASLAIDYPKSLRFKTLVESNYIPKINMNFVTATITGLSAFLTRYYISDTGKDSAAWIYERYRSYIGSNSRCSVASHSHSWVQPSIIGRIQGKVSNELVIVGAHQDSIRTGNQPALQAPGADDDASGTATIMECFRLLCSDPNFYPDYTIEFHAYAAEEVGLRGSQAIANDYAARRGNNVITVVGMLQIDMDGYRAGDPAVITDYVDSPLTTFLRLVIGNGNSANPTGYCTIPFTTSTCGYACSDHASWYRANYPACFPFESTMSRSNPYIHTATDTLSRLDAALMQQFVRMVLGFIYELSHKW